MLQYVILTVCNVVLSVLVVDNNFKKAEVEFVCYFKGVTVFQQLLTLMDTNIFTQERKST